MFAAGLVIFLKKGRVIAVAFLKLHPSFAYRLTSELRLIRELTPKLLDLFDAELAETMEQR